MAVASKRKTSKRTVEQIRAELERLDAEADATIDQLHEERRQREEEIRADLDAKAPTEPPDDAGPNWADNERRMRWAEANRLSLRETQPKMGEARRVYAQKRMGLAAEARELCFGAEPVDPDALHYAGLCSTKEIAAQELSRQRERGNAEMVRALALVSYERRWDLVAAQAIPIEALQLLDELESGKQHGIGPSRWTF